MDDDEDEAEYLVNRVHDERGYAEIRRALARRHDIGYVQPDIQVVDVDLEGDRRLVLQHNVTDGMLLDADDVEAVLKHVAYLWGYGVTLTEIEPATEAELKTYSVD